MESRRCDADNTTHTTAKAAPFSETAFAVY